MSVSLLLPLATTAILLLPMAGAAGSAAGCCGQGWHGDDQNARAEFTLGVNQYVELHRSLAAPLGPEQMCSDPEELHRAAAALAAAIREARSTARLGDIFTTRAAAYFRSTIATAARGWYDVPALLDEMDEEGLPVVVELDVNGTFPWSAGNLMPGRLLRVLPELPEELEYRFVGVDLVLLDVRANLVVDVLENALPAGEPEPSPDDEDGYGPCDVHPELPWCWM